MINTVYFKKYDPPALDISEALRYMRSGKDEQSEEIVRECFKQVEKLLSYRVCYREFPVSSCGEALDLDFVKTDSKDLKKNLCGAEKIILFAASIGMELDRFAARFEVVSPVKALAVDALGSERIESLCNTFCEDIQKQYRKEGLFALPRFSAGYGDLDIKYQKDILAALNAQKLLGLTLSDGYLMLPSKSVTGIIGLSATAKHGKTGCESCENYTCEFRRKV